MTIKISDKNPWLLRKIVLPQHVDHAGVMWHGSYISLLEESRINSLYQSGLSYEELSRKGIEMPVVSLRLNYKQPIFHGETILLKSFCNCKNYFRINWETEFYNSNNFIVANASIDLALVKKRNDKLTIIRKPSEDIIKAIRNLKKGPMAYN